MLPNREQEFAGDKMVLMKILMRTLPKVPSLAPCDDTVVDDADDADDDDDDAVDVAADEDDA